MKTQRRLLILRKALTQLLKKIWRPTWDRAENKEENNETRHVKSY